MLLLHLLSSSKSLYLARYIITNLQDFKSVNIDYKLITHGGVWVILIFLVQICFQLDLGMSSRY